MKPALWFWARMSVLGGFVLAPPDRGERVVSLTGAHGPSLLDLVGIVVLVVGWLPLVVMLWCRRARLRQKCGPVLGVFAVFPLDRSLGLVVTSVLSELGVAGSRARSA